MNSLPQRTFHPDMQIREIWPGADGYQNSLWKWTREALLRPVGPGHLLATWTTGGPTEPWEGNHTVIRQSFDDGATWQDAGAFRHPVRGLFTTELFVPRPGEVHAFLNTYANGVWMTQLGSYRSISRDGGKNWTTPHSLPGGIHNVWPNRGIRHSSGRWIIPVSWAELVGEEWMEPHIGRPPQAGQIGHRLFEPELLPVGVDYGRHYRRANAWADANHRYACGVMLSDDEGATFRRQGYLKGGLHDQLIEPRVVELSDGRVAMLLRAQRDGRLWRSDSADAGETWSQPVRTGIPNPAAKVSLLRAKDGRIFLVHNPVEIEGVVYGKRNPLSLWISSDDMKTWETQVELVRDASPSACLNYPDGFLDEAAHELVFCWEDARSVFLTRVPFDIC